MSDFKVGDTVKIIKAEYYDAEHELGAIGLVTEVGDSYCMVNVGKTVKRHSSSINNKNWHFSYNYASLERVTDSNDEDHELVSDDIDVKKQLCIYLHGANKVHVSHVTNTKKRKVMITTVHQKGNRFTIKYDDVDSVIELLTKLKEEVNAAG